VRTPFDSAVEPDDLLAETRAYPLRYGRAESAAGLADGAPSRQRIKTSENLVLMEPRPIGPLIPFRAGGLAILGPGKGAAGACSIPANGRCRNGRGPLVSPRAADGCIARVIREPVRATPTSPAALLLP
jgi:hypothetical protein